MKCAKCGYERQSRDDAFVPLSECPACGVVYAKHGAAVDPEATLDPVRPPHLKPSPVDAISLRKARERVEKRLRERQEARVKDDRHAQTLKLAKRLTSEQIRRRQEEKKLNGADKQAKQPAADLSSPGDHGNDIRPDNTPDVIDQPSQTAMANTTGQAAATGNQDLTSAEHVLTETVSAVPHASDASEQENQSGPAPSEQPREEEPILLQEAVVQTAQQPVPDDQPKIFRALAASQGTANNAAIDETARPVPRELLTAAAVRHPAATRPGGGLSRFLPVVAWLILSAGIIGAVLSWATIGDVEAGVRIPIAESMSSMPLGLLLGFAYLATGVLGFAFFWVSSLISSQLNDIRRLLITEDDSR